MTTSIKKEIMEEFKKKFYKKLVNQEIFEGFFDTSDFDEAESFLSQALTRIEEKSREEERKRIEKAMQPAFDDFNAAGQRMIEVVSLKRTGTEIIENIGYMKSVLLSPSEEKESVSDTNVTSKEEEECICKECQNGEICEACEDFGHQSPKKE